ncbi:MINDY deubiquitinase domain [Trinorchestia longiramus]|nr:MINDY deubiquitinase domain [Trinorchestia longiramus]
MSSEVGRCSEAEEKSAENISSQANSDAPSQNLEPTSNDEKMPIQIEVPAAIAGEVTENVSSSAELVDCKSDEIVRSPVMSISSPIDEQKSEDTDNCSILPVDKKADINLCTNLDSPQKACTSNVGCDDVSLNENKCQPDLAEVSNAYTELPSLGILVVDDGHNAAASPSKSVTAAKLKQNETIKSVSAKIRMEPVKADTPYQENKNVEKLDKLLELASSVRVDEAASTERTVPSTDKPQVSLPDAAGFGARRKSEPLSPTAAAIPPHEVLHRVKKIKFKGKEIPIITQNNNGPCPLLAILNALLLRGEVELGVDSHEVKGGHLVSIVANALIDLAPRGGQGTNAQQQNLIQQNTDDAVQVLDKLLTGLDVNVRFSGVQDFEFTSELCVFDGLSIPLYHGWVVDPEWPAAEVVQDLTYNQLTNNILTWRHQASDNNDDMLIMKAVLCEEYLHATSSQLTVHGLFALGSTMGEEEVAVLFRNNHFSTIYKHKEQLYQLLTDQGFLTEAAVWQTLSDVDASFSEFVTAAFEPWQQQAASPVSSSLSSTAAMTQEQQITSDEQLAAVLQQESDQRCKDEALFSETLQQLGCDSSMSDEEIARRLQDEEVRVAEAQASEARAEASGEDRVPSTRVEGLSPPPPPPSSPTKHGHSRKKKDQCCIL